MRIIGFDFSINKPAACVYENNTYQFYSWPIGLNEKIIKIYRDSGVNLFYREDKRNFLGDSSEKMRNDVSNAVYLSNLIISSFSHKEFHNDIIVFEGLSFASKGNVVLQLGGYKYILMKEFYDKSVPWDHMITYAPITLKKTAGASKKGMGKKEMIESFLKKNSCSFAQIINSNKNLFQKKTGNWIDHLDDLVDSFWAIETFKEKNKI